MMRRVFHFLVIFVILFSGCTGFRKKYSVAIDPTFYPANMGGQASNVYGFMVDLLEEIGKSEGVLLTYKQVGSESVLNGLERKAYDGVLTPKSNVMIEKNIYSISNPIMLTGPVLVTGTDSKVKDILQLQGKIVGVVDQSDALLLIQKYAKVFIFTYPSAAYLMEALNYNIVDGALLDSLEARAFVNNIYAGSLKIVTKPLNNEGIYLATMAGKNPLLLDLFNTGLKRMQKRGIYQKLLKKWGLSFDLVKESP